MRQLIRVIWVVTLLALIPACGELPVIIIPIPNTPPSAGVTPIAGTQTGIFAVTYTLTDAESSPVAIVVEISIDAGMNWSTATRAPGGEGTTGLASLPTGSSHTFLWDSAADGVGRLAPATATFRVTPSDADPGSADSTDITVDNTVVAFRMTSFNQRDPHTWYGATTPFPIPCSDIQDVFTPPQSIPGFPGYGTVSGGLNEVTTKALTTDGDGDGFLDSSPLLLFRIFDPLTATGVLEFADGHCNAAGTSCDLVVGSTRTPTTLTNATATPLLAPVASTTSGYTPAVATPGGVGFVTAPIHYVVNLGSLLLPLDEYQVAAVYSPVPPGATLSLASGLAMGFLTQTVAETTFITIGGSARSLASLLAGGAGGCGTPSDKDTGPGGAPGWWFYFNFTADLVTYTGP